jgi:hypothetical protein
MVASELNSAFSMHWVAGDGGGQPASRIVASNERPFSASSHSEQPARKIERLDQASRSTGMKQISTQNFQKHLNSCVYLTNNNQISKKYKWKLQPDKDIGNGNFLSKMNSLDLHEGNKGS